jgi:hypothetical protein
MLRLLRRSAANVKRGLTQRNRNSKRSLDFARDDKKQLPAENFGEDQRRDNDGVGFDNESQSPRPPLHHKIDNLDQRSLDW